MKLVLVLSSLVIACSPAPAPKPPLTEQPDASKAPSCGDACEHLRVLGCSLGKPTNRGASCEAVCDNVQATNAGVGFPVACLASAKTCALADGCR